MSLTVTWLHLSDLHYCESETGWDADRVLEALQEDLKRLRADHALSPDLAFFTGDCAFGQLAAEEGRSIQSQFGAARQVFDGIRKSFEPHVRQNNFFIVPGNHDVNRTGIPDATWAWLDNLPRNHEGRREITDAINRCNADWKLCMRRLADYGSFLDDSGSDHLLRDPDRLIYAETREINGVNIGLAGLNSAWSSGRDNEKSKLWLAVDWQIKQLKRRLKAADITIALMHHPPSWLTEAESPARSSALGLANAWRDKTSTLPSKSSPTRQTLGFPRTERSTCTRTCSGTRA